MIDEADLQYLRNINTKPGPDAGRSIDPTKPGPDEITTSQAEHDRNIAGFETLLQRLAAELKQVEGENEHHIRLAFIDAGANPAITWKQEAERLAAENERLIVERNEARDICARYADRMANYYTYAPALEKETEK